MPSLRATVRWASCSAGPRNPSSEGPDYNDLGSADFVIKPAADGVSSVKFGEMFLKKAVNASISVNTFVIRSTDARFKLIKAQLQRARMCPSRR